MIRSLIAFILIQTGSTSPSPAIISFTPEIPDECKHATICDSIPNYPSKQMDIIIEELNKKGIHPNKIDSDELDVPNVSTNDIIPDFAYSEAKRPMKPSSYIPGVIKISDTDYLPGGNDTVDVKFEKKAPTTHEVSLCRTVIAKKYPKAVKGKDNKWYYAVNNDRNPYQAFLVELCASDAFDKPCGNGDLEITFYSGYEARCIQKYVWRPVVAVNHTGQYIKLRAEMPSCCSCVAKTVFNIIS